MSRLWGSGSINLACSSAQQHRNIDDIATDLACNNCKFLHGFAHEGMAGAVLAVWAEAEPEVSQLGLGEIWGHVLQDDGSLVRYP